MVLCDFLNNWSSTILYLVTCSDQPMQSLTCKDQNLVDLICDFVVIITSYIHEDVNGIRKKPKNCKQMFFNKMHNSQCRNLNIGFATKCEVQGPMRLKVCFGVKHILTNGGECKG